MNTPTPGIDVSVACRVLNVSRLGYYDWKGWPLSARAAENELLTKSIVQIHHCTQHTSWAFGQRLRAANLLGSMGTIGDCYDTR